MNNFLQIKNSNDNPERVLSYIKSVEWKHWLNRPYSVFWATFFWAGLTKKYFEEAGLDYFATDSNLYQYPDLYYSSTFEKRSNEWAEDFFAKNKVSKLSDLIAETHKKSMIGLGELISSNEDIKIKLRKYFDLCRVYVPYLWLVLPMESYFTKQIDSNFPKFFGEDYKKHAADLSLPIKKNVHNLMLDALIDGIPIDEVRKKYGWMKSRDGFSPFYTNEELEDIKNNHKNQSIVDEKPPQELSELVMELKELSFFRTDRLDKFNELLNGGKPLFEEIAKLYDMTLEELKLCDADSLVEGNPKKYSKIFSYALFENEYVIQNEQFFPDLNKHEHTEIKGSIAFKGKVSGLVKIVTHPNDLVKVNAGDVMVSQMTFPSFISAMQKAVAFVTDEGSITCHAAIIAREMKKPCIIGTKIATKVLKDGDIVEVDADNGVVRIIK